MLRLSLAVASLLIAPNARASSAEHPSMDTVFESLRSVREFHDASISDDGRRAAWSQKVLDKEGRDRLGEPQGDVGRQHRPLGEAAEDDSGQRQADLGANVVNQCGEPFPSRGQAGGDFGAEFVPAIRLCGEHEPLQELTVGELHKTGEHEFLNWMVLLGAVTPARAQVRYFGELRRINLAAVEWSLP